MSGVYCYIQRGGGGSVIRGLRLVDRRQAREWTPGGGGEGSLRSGPEHDQENILAAARWIAQQFAQAPGSPKSRGLTICLDVDGGRCAWLSPASADAEAVRAAALAAAAGAAGVVGGGGSSPSPDEPGSVGPGMGAVWSSEFGEVGLDLSVQGLDGLEPAGTNGPALPRTRLAALAVPDVPVRVLLDELDRLGVEVRAVTTLWHLLASAWDPAQAEAHSAGVLGAAGNGRKDSAVISTSEPVSAVVLLDPAGRLCWAWSRGGRLIAAGSQRLRTLELAKAAPSMPMGDDEVLTGARRLAGVDALPGVAGGGGAGGAGRVGGVGGSGGATMGGETSLMLEVSRFDAGRVTGEWLAWAAQLGVAPARIVCLGPDQIVATGLGDGAGLAAVGQALTRSWPGAGAAAIEHDDPVLATLGRLAGSDADGPDAESAEADGGRMLMELSSRPGKLSRAMHWWLALCGLGGAAALCVLAWRLEAGVTETRDQAKLAIAQRGELFKSVEKLFPRLADKPNPVGDLAVGLKELAKNRDDVTPEYPVLPALERVIAAAGQIPGLHLKQFSASAPPSGISAEFVAPDAEPGGRLLDALRQDSSPLPGGVRVRWDGDTAPTTVPVTGMADPQRIFKLRGTWVDARPGEGAGSTARGSAAAPGAGATGAAGPVSGEGPAAAPAPGGATPGKPAQSPVPEKVPETAPEGQPKAPPVPPMKTPTEKPAREAKEGP